MVQTPAGEWWATFLAVQPYEGDHYNTGRETFLMPVRWEDGWPRITDPGQPLPRVHRRPNLPADTAPVPTSGPFAVRDEFDGAELPPYWMMMRNPRSRWYDLDDGRLRLEARAEGLGDNANPSFLGRRQQHMNAIAETVARFAPRREGDRAGLAALQNDDYWYFLSIGLRNGAYEVMLERRAGPDEPAAGTVIASAPLPSAPGAPVRLKVEARGPLYDFSYAVEGGAWTPLLTGADGRILSTRTAGGFVGAVFGPHAVRGDQ